MNENVIRRLFPNASRSTFAANRKVSDSGAQQNQTTALDGAVCGKEDSMVRVVVRFRGFRCRPLDPDSFAGSVKDLLDGLRHACLIPDDTIWAIGLETSQVKVRSYEDEKTEIEIIYPPGQTKGTTVHDGYIDLLFFDKEQDEKTARSARMIAYTDQEIEQLANQPKLETTNEHRQRVSK